MRWFGHKLLLGFSLLLSVGICKPRLEATHPLGTGEDREIRQIDFLLFRSIYIYVALGK